MKEEGQFYKRLPQMFYFLPRDLVMIFQSLVIISPRFFDFERPQLSPSAKIKKLRQNFVAMNMMNKCAKFHKDSLSDKKVKFNLPSAIQLSETADFVSNFVCKPYASKQLRWHI